MDFNIASSVFRSIDIIKGEAATQASASMKHYGPGSIARVTLVGPVCSPDWSTLYDPLASLFTIVSNFYDFHSRTSGYTLHESACGHIYDEQGYLDTWAS